MEIDRDKCEVRGVKLCGLVSVNGRKYTAEALKEGVSLYEGRAVNIDHAKDPNQPRSYADRFGATKGVHFKEDGLYGTLKYNPKHRLAEQFLHDAEHNPAACGFSPVHECQMREENGVPTVVKIVDVRHVDLVADPATTKSLSEGRKITNKIKIKSLLEGKERPRSHRIAAREMLDAGMEPDQEMDEPDVAASHEDVLRDGFKQALAALVSDEELSDDEKLQKFKELLGAKKKLLPDSGGDTEEEGEDEDEVEEAEGDDEEDDEDEDEVEEGKKSKKKIKEGKKASKTRFVKEGITKLVLENRALKVIAKYKLSDPDGLLTEAMIGLGDSAKMTAFAMRQAKLGETKNKPKSYLPESTQPGQDEGYLCDTPPPVSKSTEDMIAWLRS